MSTDKALADDEVVQFTGGCLYEYSPLVHRMHNIEQTGGTRVVDTIN